jgi:LacI family transcriptional regulator
MRVTIKDIAKKAGVGISTVSRVINNSGYASEAVRKRVIQAVRHYNYNPNVNAQNLKVNSTKNIALLVKGIANPFFSKLILVIEEKTALRGYQLFIQNVEEHTDEMDLALRFARDRNLCGVMILGGCFGYQAEMFERLGIPCVLITVSAGLDVPGKLYASVKIDDEKEGYRATEYLLSLGHRRIGFIFEPPQEPMTPNRLRFFGYQRALKDYGVPFDPLLVADNLHAPNYSGYLNGFNAMKQLRYRCRDMSAVFSFADILALGAAKEACSAGLRIPKDISIMGFDGIDAGEYFHPSLDTIYQPAAEMALSAVEFLFDMLQGGPAQHRIYDGVLAKRGSCHSIS